jgi:ATP-dependent DNA ligase
MLAEARSELPPERALPGGLVFEQKPDGYRTLLFASPGRAHLQSRNGADLSGAFPKISVAGRVLRVPLVLDGELVVATEGRLDFGQLQQRARSRGTGARQAARTTPAHLIFPVKCSVLNPVGRTAWLCSGSSTAAGAVRGSAGF